MQGGARSNSGGGGWGLVTPKTPVPTVMSEHPVSEKVEEGCGIDVTMERAWRTDLYIPWRPHPPPGYNLHISNKSHPWGVYIRCPISGVSIGIRHAHEQGIPTAAEWLTCTVRLNKQVVCPVWKQNTFWVQGDLVNPNFTNPLTSKSER